MKIKNLIIMGIMAVIGANAYANNGLNYTKTRVFPQQMFAENKSAPAAAGKVLYYGGAVISHAQVYLVLWGDKVAATTKNAMPDFYSSIVNSTYMDFLTVYNTTGIKAQDGRTGTNQTIGRGNFVQTIQLNPAKQSGTIDDSEIRAELEKQIAAGVLPPSSPDNLYMIHFPKGLKITFTDGTTVATSCQQFCAFHGGFKPKTGADILYSVIPDLDSTACAFGCGSGGSLARITVSASHELIEAITDPIPTPGTNPAFPQAWNTVDGFEVGDLCQSNTGVLKGKSGASYTIQQEWDNSKNACTTTSLYVTK